MAHEENALPGEERAANAVARLLGFEDASDPAYIARCEKEANHAPCEAPYVLTAEDRDILREIESGAKP